MRNLTDELLLCGALFLIFFKTVFYFDNYVLADSSLARYSSNLLESIVLLFGLYVAIVVFWGIRFISRRIKNISLAYYMKSIGWIPYAYFIGGILYLSGQTLINQYTIEKYWNTYFISEISIIISLLIAWIRKHPRFLVE